MRLEWWLRAAIAAVIVWAAVDLWGPRHSDLRHFDPHQVARLETEMWRSYYDHRRLALFFQLSELMRTQYDFPLLRSLVASYDAARAAVVFQRGHQRQDYEQALPSLRKFYGTIRRVSSTGFDVEQAARRELEWWIVHRERRQYGRDALVRTLAELQECLYSGPAGTFTQHPAARADAMILRDDESERNGVTPQDWSKIREMLDVSWSSLHRAVN